MAIDSKIIRIRRGTAADFNVGKTKLVQGEFAVVTDTKEAYFAAENGEAVRLATEKDVSQLQGQIDDLDVRSITSIEKTSTDGLVDTYTISFSDGTSQTYTVTNGDVSDEKIQQFITDWLDAHPEATTTVQDGVITYAKLADDVKEVIDKASKSGGGGKLKLARTMPIGEIFEKKDKYCAWAMGNCVYDKYTNRVIIMCNAKESHMTGLGTVYMYTIDCVNYKVSEPVAVAEPVTIDGTEYGQMTNSTCVLSDGTYVFLTKCHAIDHPDTVVENRLYKSTDYGVTWTYEVVSPFTHRTTGTCPTPFSLIQTMSGRLVFSDSGYILYSDDLGSNWTVVTTSGGSTEQCIIELKENVLMAIGRKGVSGFNTKTCALINFSYDNGTTWTTPVDSETILDMTQNTCSGFVSDDGILTLFYGSRLNNNGYMGALYKQSATIDDALNDNFGEAKLVCYGTNVSNQDFGYPASCETAEGDIFCMYFDGDETFEGSTNYKFVRGSRTAISQAFNDDWSGKTSTYSSERIDELISQLRASLTHKINQIIIAGGGTPEGGEELDGSMYITDGLREYFDFTNESTFDTSDASYTGTMTGTKIYESLNHWSVTAPTNKEFIKTGLSITGYATSGSADVINTEEGTIEIVGYSTNGSICGWYGLGGIIHAITLNGTSLKSSYTKTDGGGSWPSISLGTVSEGFHIVTITYDVDSIKAYMDGVLMGEIIYAELSDFGAVAHSSGTNIAINVYTQNTEPAETGLAQYMKEFRTYDRVLSKEEVINNHKYAKSVWGF